MDYGLIGTIAIIVVIIAIGIIAVKFSFNLKIDWAKRQNRKDKKMRLKLINTCPHATIESFDKETGKGVIRNLYVSPPMSFSHTCEWCGHTTQSLHHIESNMKRWGSDLMALVKQIDEYNKLGKKYLN